MWSRVGTLTVPAGAGMTLPFQDKDNLTMLKAGEVVLTKEQMRDVDTLHVEFYLDPKEIARVVEESVNRRLRERRKLR